MKIKLEGEICILSNRKKINYIILLAVLVILFVFLNYLTFFISFILIITQINFFFFNKLIIDFNKNHLKSTFCFLIFPIYSIEIDDFGSVENFFTKKIQSFNYRNSIGLFCKSKPKEAIFVFYKDEDYSEFKKFIKNM